MMWASSTSAASSTKIICGPTFSRTDLSRAAPVVVIPITLAFLSISMCRRDLNFKGQDQFQNNYGSPEKEVFYSNEIIVTKVCFFELGVPV